MRRGMAATRRVEDGREDEWFGNYGILIEEIGKDAFVLRCSDGIGLEPSFDDLVVQVELVRHLQR